MLRRELVLVGRGDGGDYPRQGGGHILRQVAAVGARIADQLVAFVEGLREVQSLLRAEAEEAVGVALQFGEIVERGRRHALRFGLDGFDGGLPGSCAGDDLPRLFAIGGQAHGLLERLLVRARCSGGGGGTVAEPGALVGGRFRRGGGPEGGLHFEVVLGDEAANREFAFDDHGEGGGLHAAHGEVFVVGQRVGAREVHAHQPVGAAASMGGVGEPVVIGGRTERVEAFADGVRGEGGDPKAAHGFGAMGGIVDVAEDELAFASGVRGAHDSRNFGRVDDAFDGLELVAGLLVDHEGPFLRQHGKRVDGATGANRDRSRAAGRGRPGGRWPR